MTALNITICPNGNQYIRKKLVLNRKRIPKFEVLLDNATQILGTRNCVRLLRTPNNGTRVKDLDSMVNGGVYVAITRPSDKLIKMQYDGSGIKQPKPPDKPANQHYLYHRKMMLKVQARAFQEALAEGSRHKNIFVYCNGEDKGMKIHLDKRVLISKDKMLQYISDKIKLRTGAVKSIHTLDGREVRQITGLENNGTYVAVGYGQRFQRTGYTEQSMSGLTPRKPAQSKLSSSMNSSSTKKSDTKRRSKERAANNNLNDSRNVATTSKQNQGNVQGKSVDGFGESGVVVETLDENEEDDMSLFEELVNKVDDDIDVEGIKNLAIDDDVVNNDYSDDTYESSKNENAIGNVGTGQLNLTFEKQGTFEKSNSLDRTSPPAEQLDTEQILDENNNTVDITSDDKLSPAFSPIENPKKHSHERSSTGFGETYDKPSLNAMDTDKSHEEGGVGDRHELSFNGEIKAHGDHIKQSSDGDNNDKTADQIKHSYDQDEIKKAKIKQKKLSKGKSEKERTPKNSTVKKSTKPKKSRKTENPNNTPVGATTTGNAIVVDDELRKSSPALEEASSIAHPKSDDVSGAVSPQQQQQPQPGSREPSKNLYDIVQTQIETKKNSESEDNDTNRKSASPTVYEASGEQSEKADAVQESKETKIEKTIDMLPADEVEEEMEEQGKTEDNKDK